jgi:hypothetical protein
MVLFDTREELAQCIALLFGAAISFAVVYSDHGREYLRTTAVGELLISRHFSGR